LTTFQSPCPNFSQDAPSSANKGRRLYSHFNRWITAAVNFFVTEKETLCQWKFFMFFGAFCHVLAASGPAGAFCWNLGGIFGKVLVWSFLLNVG
jgi:hypothetical protein